MGVSSAKGLSERHPKGQQSQEAAFLLWGEVQGDSEQGSLSSLSCQLPHALKCCLPRALLQLFSQLLVTQLRTPLPLHCLPTQTPAPRQ